MVNRDKKSTADTINEIGDFIHQAWCVDGETKFVRIVDPTPTFNCNGIMFEITDKKRGLFYITISTPK